MPETLKFIPECEPWTIYRYEDGTLLKCRVVLTAVSKADEPGPDGKPVYLNKFQLIQDIEFSDGQDVSNAIMKAARRGEKE